jgi:hypothetical protein
MSSSGVEGVTDICGGEGASSSESVSSVRGESHRTCGSLDGGVETVRELSSLGSKRLKCPDSRSDGGVREAGSYVKG